MNPQAGKEPRLLSAKRSVNNFVYYTRNSDPLLARENWARLPKKLLDFIQNMQHLSLPQSSQNNYVSSKSSGAQTPARWAEVMQRFVILSSTAAGCDRHTLRRGGL